jgi:hypothetical protein
LQKLKGGSTPSLGVKYSAGNVTFSGELGLGVEAKYNTSKGWGISASWGDDDDDDSGYDLIGIGVSGKTGGEYTLVGPKAGEGKITPLKIALEFSIFPGFKYELELIPGLWPK